LNITRDSIEEIQVWLRSDKNNGHFTQRRMYIIIASRWIMLRMGKVSDIYFIVNILFFRKSCNLWDNLEK